MKELIGVLVLATSFTCLAQVSIGTPTPHPSAALEINSTTKGFLLPRMTELQMISIDNAIAVNPKELEYYMSKVTILFALDKIVCLCR